MRVAHILKVKAIAGAETHLLTLLEGQRARQVDASFVMMASPSNPMEIMVEAAQRRHIPIERLIIHHHADVTVYRRLRHLLHDLKPDIAHTHLQHGDLFGIPAARLAGVPVVVTSRHNDDIRRRQLPVKLLNRWLWRGVDAGIAISEAIRQFSVEIEGAPADKVHTIHYGIASIMPDIDPQKAKLKLRHELNLNDEAILVGMVCRLIELKGVSYALQALKRVSDRFPQAHLVIAGDGPLRDNLEVEAKTLGVAERIHFLGWQNDIPQIMAGFDLLVVASLREGFGLVMLEAMAQAVPIIATRVSAIPEVVMDGETGLLIAPRDAEALAEGLGKLLGDRPLRQHMGLLGQDRMETHFGAARMIDETLALYERLLRQKKA